MNQQRVFITFGGPTENYQKRSKILEEQARKSNFFTCAIGLTDEYLKSKPIFWRKHGDFLEQNTRGYGFWLWKPYIIKMFLDAVNDGDILVYADAGCEINVQGSQRYQEYLNLLNNNVEGKGVLSFQLNHLEIRFTKKQVLDRYNVSKEKMYSGQNMATVILLKKNEHSKNLVDEWYQMAEKYENICDISTSETVYSEFVDHRHDQSLFSLVVKKHGSISLPDETFFSPNWSKGIKFPFLAKRNRNE
jgi:hypothetical protein